MTQTVSEPAWLAGRRAVAARPAPPVPSNRDEAWRYTNLRGFDPDAYDRQPATLTLSEAELPEGVVGSLARLAAERPELVEPHYGSVVSGEEKFAAGNVAAWTDGVLLYVPAGVEWRRRCGPRSSCRGRRGHHHRTLVVLERGARATLPRPTSDVPGYVNTVVELVVGDGARLEYVTTQKHHAETRQFGTHRATVGRDGEVDGSFSALAGRGPVPDRDLPGGSGRERRRSTRAYFLAGSEHADYDTTQEHAAPNTTSDLYFKGVPTDHARAVWRGVIRVRQGCPGDGRLPGEPEPAALPRGACRLDTGPRDRGQRRALHARRHDRPDRPAAVFHPMSRGLSRLEAERLIVRGFFQPILDRINSAEVRDSLAAELELRMGSSTA